MLGPQACGNVDFGGHAAWLAVTSDDPLGQPCN
jgi:hypothetical protein